MKKIYSLLFLLLPLIGFSQFEIKVVAGDTVQEAYVDHEIKIKMHVKNISTNGDRLDLRWRLLNDFTQTSTPNWTNYVCEGILCYSSQTRTQDFNATLFPDDSVDIYTYILMSADTGTGKSCLVIFEPNDSANTVQKICLTGRATIDPTTGIEDINANDVLSQNAPNPFNASTKINYEVKGLGSLKIQDLTGKLINEINLESGKGSVEINNLNAGIYFYSLWDNGQMIATKRMQVVH